MAMTQAADALCLKFAKVTGKSTASSTITITGMVAEDSIVFCFGIPDNTTADPVDYTAYASAAAGGVSVSTATTSKHLLVLWLDRSA